MTCKDCIHEKVCKNAYLFKVTPPNVCGYFRNKADFAEVKHGENITEQDPYDDFICSECGFELESFVQRVYDEENDDYSYYGNDLNYCPNCGAKMDGKPQKEV